jgi:hypothetical protein
VELYKSKNDIQVSAPTYKTTRCHKAQINNHGRGNREVLMKLHRWNRPYRGLVMWYILWVPLEPEVRLVSFHSSVWLSIHPATANGMAHLPLAPLNDLYIANERQFKFMRNIVQHPIRFVCVWHEIFKSRKASFNQAAQRSKFNLSEMIFCPTINDTVTW